MIPIKDRVIIIEASPPDAHNPANIKWVTAETPDEGTDYYTDSDYMEVRVHACNLLDQCGRNGELPQCMYMYTVISPIVKGIIFNCFFKIHCVVIY